MCSMRRKIVFLISVLVIILCSFSTVSGEQDKSIIKIKLPSFPVTLNGQLVDNDYSKYPFIVYKNITYFPMTYSGCRFLGVESEWKGNQEGLIIEKADVTAAYNAYKASFKNLKSYNAKIAPFPIKVNGKTINNSQEQYPLLYFRDIIYFPMTWKFCVDEFGWSYSFDDTNGLEIKSDNIPLSQISISKDRPKQKDGQYSGVLSDCVAISDGYVYYEANNGKIMQMSLSDTSKQKEIYQLEIWSYGDGKTYVYPKLSKLNGNMLLTFHQGGAVMGADYIIELKPDGTTEEIQSSYFGTTVIGNKQFSYYYGQMTGPGNLNMRVDGELKQIGSKAHQFYSITNDKIEGVQDFYLIGEDLYLRASKGAYSQDTFVYKVNINTNETIKVSERDTRIAQIEGDYLYYLNTGSVYKVSLKDGTENCEGKLAGVSEAGYESSFVALGGKIYWKNEKNMELYTLGESESLNPGAKVDSMGITGSNGEYMVCTFEETPSSEYRIMVFDKSGKIVFKTSDKSYTKNITIEGNKIYFYNITTGTICIGSLK